MSKNVEFTKLGVYQQRCNMMRLQLQGYRGTYVTIDGGLLSISLIMIQLEARTLAHWLAIPGIFFCVTGMVVCWLTKRGIIRLEKKIREMIKGTEMDLDFEGSLWPETGIWEILLLPLRNGDVMVAIGAILLWIIVLLN